MTDPLWKPSEARIANTRISDFISRHCPEAADSDGLWQWSVDNPGEFWRALWDYVGVLGDPGDRLIEAGPNFWEHRFLPDATLNVAENYLADREGADPVALLAYREDGSERQVSWVELRQEVAAMAAFFRSVGVEPGDRVAAWMPHIPETMIAFLAAASIGAVFTSTSADFGTDGVLDRFSQTEPTVLIAADGYSYGGRSFDCLGRLSEIVAGLPSVREVVVVGYLDSGPDIGSATLWSDAAEQFAGADHEFAAMAFDHPLYILYSSGTTGKPKCIVHRSGGVMLKLASELALHCDVHAGDRVFYFTTCGWMMWNWLVAGLGMGSTLVLYDGNPAYPGVGTLFDLADKYDFTLFGVSAKFLDASMKADLRPRDTHQLASLRTICSTGSPLSHEGFAWAYDAIKQDVHLSSMSGGTDLCGCLVAGNPTKPVFAGEIQQKAFGLGIGVFDDDGQPLAEGIKGELVCTTPFPSMPIEFWKDDDGSRYRSAYFERFEGVWAHGDYASWTEHGGMVIHGRSDATLNASGVRIGTAEIYRVVEQLDEVVEGLAIGQEWDGDTRIVLFVRLGEGHVLTDELQQRIRSELRSRCSPRHVPGLIAAVADIPRTRSGKIVELAVTEIVHGRTVKNLEALANPEALEYFRPEAIEGLS
jgi:acetoacetyl-CoA synthetase